MKPSPLDGELAALAKDWQNQPVTHQDASLILKRIKRRVWLSRLSIVCNVLMTLGFFIALCWGYFYSDWSTPVLLYVAFGAIYSAIFVFYEFRILQNKVPPEAQTPSGVVPEAIISTQRSLKYIDLNIIAAFVMLPALNMFIYALSKTSESMNMKVYWISNGLILVMLAILFILRRRRQGELKRLNTFVEDPDL